MRAPSRSVVLAIVQTLILSSVAAILLIERAVWPRVWVKTALVDVRTPPRGRYVRLRIEIEGDSELRGRQVTLGVREGRMVATQAAIPGGIRVLRDPGLPPEELSLQVDPPLTVFLPAQLTVPWPRPADEEVWAEVTVPSHGLPRPIRLGLKKNGVLTPF